MKNQFHPKYQRKYFWISALKFFVASWGLPGDLVSNMIDKEAYRTPKKIPGSPKEATYKNFQGRNPYNIFVAILENQCPHEFIPSLIDL